LFNDPLILNRGVRLFNDHGRDDFLSLFLFLLFDQLLGSLGSLLSEYLKGADLLNQSTHQRCQTVNDGDEGNPCPQNEGNDQDQRQKDGSSRKIEIPNEHLRQ
jgi:hypothetical protein